MHITLFYLQQKVYTYPQAPNMLNPNSWVQQRISRKESLHKLPRTFHSLHFLEYFWIIPQFINFKMCFFPAHVLVCFLMLSCMSCLYILNINSFSVISFANIFSHSVVCLFTLSVVSFAV